MHSFRNGNHLRGEAAHPLRRSRTIGSIALFNLAHGRGIIADVFSVNQMFPVRRVGELPVRLRCMHCEVAWSGPQRSGCWVCGEPGTALNTAVAARDRTVSAFDLELLF
jgi:hypothetical protein